jgi:putative transposase
MEFDIGKICIVFKVSRSGFYASMNSGLSFRGHENQQLTSQILKVYVDSKSTYGSPRIARELNRRGTKISRPRCQVDEKSKNQEHH